MIRTFHYAGHTYVVNFSAGETLTLTWPTGGRLTVPEWADDDLDAWLWRLILLGRQAREEELAVGEGL